MLPPVLPVFPLSQVLLLPHTYLPLHIFEGRYREMIREVLVSHQHFLLALSQVPVTTDPADRPPLFDVACLARIVQAEPLPDGRWNLLVEGMGAHRILEEVSGRSFRQARSEALAFDPSPMGPELHARVFACLDRFADRQGIRDQLRELMDLPLDLEAQLFTLALALDFEPVEKQFLLESPGLPTLGERFHQLLDFALADRGVEGGIH